MRKEIDLLNGNIKSSLVRFALPLFLGNLFQQLYNAADSLIVGNLIGPEALAAVSSSSPLIFMMIGFFNGVAIGAGVVISRAYGAKDDAALEKAVHTDIAFGLLSGLFLTLFATLFTPSILRMMKTPESILPNSIAYFRIYSAGIIFSLMYNFLMGIMNAVGDSRHPLYYLILSSVTNVILDIFFIAVLGYGVGSAALATIISQALSSVLCFIRLLRIKEKYRIRINKIRFDGSTLKEIIRFGLPSGIQNSVIGIANTVVQTNINTFSAFNVAASGAYSRIEGFVFLPITSFSLALTTFIGQNLGAKNYERAKKGASFGILTATLLAEMIGLFFFIAAPFLISLFSDNETVIYYGARQARFECFFYCFLALSHSISGVLRGCGKASVPMAIMLLVWCLFRVLYVTVALSVCHAIELVYVAYPLTWTISSVIFIIYLKKSDWLHALDRRKI